MIEAYVELHAHSFFSLLDGASSPEVLISTAQELGLTALALTDHNSLAGVVRLWKAAQQAGFHAIFGAEVTLVDNHHLTLLAENREGYASLCRLLTAAQLVDTPRDAAGAMTTDPKQWPGKASPTVTWEILEKNRCGLLALSGCRRGPVTAALLARQPQQAKEAAARLRDLFGRDQVWIELQHHYLPEDDRLVRELVKLAGSLDLPCVVTNNVHYAMQSGSRLRDALLAIDQNLTLTDARRGAIFSTTATIISPRQQKWPRAFVRFLRPSRIRSPSPNAARWRPTFPTVVCPTFPCRTA
jgi:error-prone DNA polymerase